jgi:two-component system, NarL family, response regulator LiaR
MMVLRKQEPNMIRILIADDHAMVRQGLNQLLNSVEEFSVIGQAYDGLEAIQLCDLLRPDVVMMDIVMPKMDGLTAARILHQRNPSVKVIVLSALEDESLLQESLLTDVEVILSKTASINEILDTVYTVSQNR